MLLGVLSLGISISGTRTSHASDIDFNRDIRPILNEHCVACHGGVKQAGDLSFVYEDQALSVIEPGEPDESPFVQRITTDDMDGRMPPPDHGRALNPDEVELLTNWIRDGASWGVHWAFVAPKATEPPALSNRQQGRSRIDHFVLAKLKDSGLDPSPEAPPLRWLRRVSLDLCGVPPSLEQQTTFVEAVKEKGDVAYRERVDQLLGSHRFGERWASVWLDSVRYADSKGMGQDGRRTIWKYRDWVISAINDDMPYDEFTIKQIAGDLLPGRTMGDRVATAGHRLTQTNEEGGTDDEQFRLEAVMDRVSTTWQAWQGMTFGCVQCHSHPYDPIDHDEYYKFLAFFNNTVDCDLSEENPRISVPLDEGEFEIAMELDNQIDEQRNRLWRSGYELLSNESLWDAVTEMTASTDTQTNVVVETVDGVAEYQTRGTVTNNTTVIIEIPLSGNARKVTAFRFTGLPKDEAIALKDSEWGFVLSHVTAQRISPGEKEPQPIPIAYVVGDEPDPLLDPQLSLTAKSQDGFGAYTRIHHRRSAAFVLKDPVDFPPGSTLRLSFKQSVFALGAFPLVAHRGRLALSDSDRWSRWFSSEPRQESSRLLSELEKQRTQIKSVKIPVLKERPKRLGRPSFVFDRGNFLTKGDPVSPGTPGFMPPLVMGSSEKLDGEEQVATRLDLAHWIAGPKNPLTARVAVNRVWAQLFGTGIVKTQEDFGASGAAPSHPGLLDDLAARFSGPMRWSLKCLLRELTLSSTYRQRSEASPMAIVKDPKNRLLSHGPRFRLPAETIRDSALFMGGLLSDKANGPPVYPPLPDGVWTPFAAADKWKTPSAKDPDRYRRTVYTYTKRSIPFPMMAAFDAPTREFCSPRRLASNTPIQALMTLNDTAFVEASQGLALRMLGGGESTEDQIRLGFQIAVCRHPTETELSKLVSLYKTIDSPKKPESSAGESGKEKVSRDHAMVFVANVLLNLDEVLSK